MNKIYIPSRGPEDWQQFLAEPEKQWKKGYSAKALAYCWEEADGFPVCVKRIFDESGFPLFKGLELLFAFPEHQVPLPGGSRPSQTDLFVIARYSDELVSIAVEGKVKEPFGPSVGEWISNSSAGKERRLAFLCEQLGLESDAIKSIRYQLLHRTVSAILKARDLNASTAVMLVHSFCQDHTWFEDYQTFLKLFGKEGQLNSIDHVGQRQGVDLYFAWVTGEAKYLNA
ncbi:MAG: hypothetical protein ACE5GY_07935 [Thermodesulfobacteriota bacterium]